MVFCGTRIAVQHLSARLANRGFSVVALSGELSQNERSHALQAVRDGRARVCVATDVAARGIDLDGHLKGQVKAAIARYLTCFRLTGVP
jgi:ATP-dependent RNA helicase DeaD